MVRTRRGVVVALLTSAGAARAQDEPPPKLPSIPCVRPRLHDVVPACAEWSFFTSAGVSSVAGIDGGRRPHAETMATFAIGSEVTWAVLRYHGFPSGAYGGARGDAEIRVGPWALAATRVLDGGAAGGLVEAGVKVHDGGTFHASWGTFDLRIGGGYGAFPSATTSGRAPHATVTLGYGVNSAINRYRSWGYARPTDLFPATVARLVLTLRRSFAAPELAAFETFFGVELSPTFFAPPVTWWRLAGGPPS